MISNEALADRKWGRYPELRKLFEKHPVPSEVYGWSSVSDNAPARISRLIEVVATIREHAKELEVVPREVADPARLFHDLDELRSEIRGASKFIERLGTQLDEVLQAAHEAAAAQEDEYRRKLLAVRAIEENRDAHRSGEPSVKQEE
jgi:hypothetical protein